MVREPNKPLLIVFAGPNGSGKSTVTPIFQSQSNFPENYINPDEIALTLGGNTMSKAYEASTIAAKKRLKCIEQKQSFSFETVMSHPSKLAILETAKQAGFEIQLIFISTDDPQTNVERVKQRVVEGGHDVPENKVISRYHRCLSLLPKASEIADKTYIFDNSDSSKLELVLSQGKIIEKPGNTIEWVEKTVATLDERRQETLAIKQRNSEFLFARLDRDEHTGKIKSIGKHFSVQQTKDGQTIVHENLILNLDNSTIGQDISISYHNGVHKANPTRKIQQARVEKKDNQQRRGRKR
jgi:predicted ABC-type ATPase